MFEDSRSDWYSMHWSGAEFYRYCCQSMKKATPCCVRIVGKQFKQFYCKQLKNGQLDKMSATVLEM